ncbi:4Fe-4S binding protein [Desulfacinum infernum]|uniref:4Fe-4S binding protein n=1 Tax=Desulfacinum infernum TaxID=35837 RepID=UPI001C4A5C81|nr:4Fe-4S binding protein [Desulfacinum infernum]
MPPKSVPWIHDVSRDRAIQTPPRVAVVDTEQCAGCGLCSDVCPVDAVTINHEAHVDPDRCIGCGTCSRECPRGAIALRSVAPRRS